jgi:hypothetical protein
VTTQPEERIVYVIIARRITDGMARGYGAQHNHRVVTAPDEATLEKALNTLANEGERGEHYQIVDVLWRP